MVLIGAFVHQKKVLISVKTKSCLSLRENIDNNYLFVDGKEILKFKGCNKNNNFPAQNCLENISNEFDRVDTEKVSSKGNVYDFSVDYDAIDKSNISNIHKYLMIKNSV